jgi:hypothetical protein
MHNLNCIFGANDLLLDNTELTNTLLKEDSSLKQDATIVSWKVSSEVDADKYRISFQPFFISR